MQKRILAMAVASLFPAFSQAASSSEKSDETIVVTANRFEQPITSTLSDIEVISQQDIQRINAKSVPELLRRLTGVQVIANGGRGQTAKLSVRGTGDSQVLVLIDGVRFARAAKGFVDFNQLPLTYIERIEYLKGARAAIYGSEAIGGVINIITRAYSSGDDSQLKLGLGSENSKNASIYGNFSPKESINLNIAMGHESTDGYNVKPRVGVNDGDEHGFSTSNGLVGGVVDLNNATSLYGSARIYKNTYQYDGSTSSVHRMKEGQRDEYSLAVGGKYKSSALISNIEFSSQNQNFWDYYKGQDRTSGSEYGTLSQDNFNWINTSQFFDQRLTLTGGVDWRSEYLNDKKNSAANQRNNSALFASSLINIDLVNLELSARRDDNEQYGQNDTYNLAVSYDFLPNLRFNASYGNAFKAPNLYQLYSPTYGSSDIKPEESRNYDLSVRATNDVLSWEVAVYSYKIDNLIEYDSGISKYANIDGKTTSKGLEITTDFSTGVVDHQLSLDFKSSEDEDGNQTNRFAKKMAKWFGTFNFNKSDVNLGAIYVGSRPDSYASSGVLPGYVVWDMSVNYYYNNALTISGRVENLFDKYYETASGYVAQPRIYYVDVVYNF